ncbi:WXG100 family type VII secretion target [Salinibacterium sp. PAMC 21357]|uniref:WXG100 family type VII secretion target n=1 Tax=Salinibacterium sp. PAMC 21357 TaxID=1112215 RepID=UPI0002898794|nr:WXG100 family type VII secretion target [Salinibacterium sp. PAMC 21357]
MTHFIYDTDKIGELGGSIELAARGIESDLMRLELELTKLAGTWSGEAQLAFEKAQADWMTSMRELERLIAAASAVCDFAVEKYESTEDLIEQAFA